MTTPDNEGFIRSFARGLTVLEAMGKNGPHTVATVAAACGLPRTVVRRILLTLADLGYATPDPDKSFHLTPKVLNLGMTYLTSLPFWSHAQRALEQMCMQVQQSCAMAVFDGSDAVFVLRIPSSKIMSLRLGMGSRIPAYATAPGRVLLAYGDGEVLNRYLEHHELKPLTPATLANRADLQASLAQIRNDGFAWVEGEFDPHVAGLAVPMYDERNHVAAAISTNFLRAEYDRAKAVKELLPPLRTASARLAGLAPPFLYSHY